MLALDDVSQAGAGALVFRVATEAVERQDQGTRPVRLAGGCIEQVLAWIAADLRAYASVAQRPAAVPGTAAARLGVGRGWRPHRLRRRRRASAREQEDDDD